MPWWYRDLATQWIQSCPCKTKTAQETQRSLQRFLEPDRNPKVIYTYNSLEFGKASEELTWNHCTSTPHRSETNGIAERKLRRISGHLQYCCNQVWMKIGGRIPWNVIVICETFKISCLMGRLHTKGVLENHFHDQVCREGGSNILIVLIKTCRDCINSVQKSCPMYCLGTHCTREEFWKGDILTADIEDLEHMDVSEICDKDSMRRKVLSYEWWKVHISGRRWNNQNFWRRSDSENITLNPGSSVRGEEQGNLWGESDGSSSTPLQGEARNDFLLLFRQF